MSLEDIFNSYWNMIFVAPLGFLLHKFVSHSNRITKLETNQKSVMENMKKIDVLCDDVSYIKGLLDEHLKK